MQAPQGPLEGAVLVDRQEAQRTEIQHLTTLTEQWIRVLVAYVADGDREQKESELNQFLVAIGQPMETFSQWRSSARALRDFLHLSKSISNLTENTNCHTCAASLETLATQLYDRSLSIFLESLLPLGMSDLERIFFPNVLTEEALRKEFRKVSLLLYPDKVNPLVRPIAQTVWQQVKTCYDHLLERQSLNYNSDNLAEKLVYYEAQARECKAVSMQYRNALKSHPEVEERFRGWTKDDLAKHQKVASLNAATLYRAAIKAADAITRTSPTPENFLKQISLRQEMAIVLNNAGHKVEAQLYLIAAIHVVLRSELGDEEIPAKVTELQKFIAAIQGTAAARSAAASAAAASASVSASSDASSQGVSTTALVTVMTNTALQRRPKQYKADVRKALKVDTTQWIVAQGVRPDGVVARYQCNREEILGIQSDAVSYYSRGTLAVAAGATAIVAVPLYLGGFAIAAVFAPVTLGFVVFASFTSLFFGWHMFHTGSELAQEPKRRTELNRILSEAHALYSKGEYPSALAKLSEQFVDMRLFNYKADSSIDINVTNLLEILLARGLRPDGVAFVLSMLADILISGRIKLSDQSQASLNAEAIKLFLCICESGATWSDKRLSELAKELDRKVYNARSQVKAYAFLNTELGRWWHGIGSVPEEYFNDAQVAPFYARLQELQDIARLNLAIMYIVDESDADSLTRAKTQIATVRENVTKSFQYFSLSDVRLEAVEDFLSAIHEQFAEENSSDAVAFIENEPRTAAAATAPPALRLGRATYPCVHLLEVAQLTLDDVLREFFPTKLSPDDTVVGRCAAVATDRDENEITRNRVTAFLDAFRNRPIAANDVSLHAHFLVFKEVLNITIVGCKTVDDTDSAKDAMFELDPEWNDLVGFHDAHGVDQFTLFLVRRRPAAVGDAGTFTSAFLIDYKDVHGKSVAGLNFMARARQAMIEASSHSGVQAINCYAKSYNCWKQALSAFAPAFWRNILFFAHYVRPGFHHGSQLVTLFNQHTLCEEEIVCIVGYVECLAKLGKVDYALGVLYKLREIRQLENHAVLWYWFAVVARRRRYYFDASYAIQKSLELNASSVESSRERTIIMNLTSRRVSEPKPVFNNIARAMDYKTRIRYDKATTNTTPDERQYYDILSIDGGGIRGIIPACLLSEVERRARYPIHKLVDMQAGTSTGALVAAALATNQRTGARPMTAGDIVTLYANPVYHKQIFTRSLTIFGILGPKYLSNRERVFSDVLGGQTLQNTLNDLLVVAVDEANDTAPHCFYSVDPASHNVKLVDALMASSAAPTFFPPHDIKINRVSHRFVDGGVQANNPASLAVSLAMGSRSIPSEKIRVWSLGTGDVIPDPDVKHSRDVNNGTLYWISKVHAVAMAGQQGTVDLNLKNQLGDRYNRWQVWMDQPYRMDDHQPDTIAALTDTALGFIEENDDMITAAVNALLVNRGFERCN